MREKRTYTDDEKAASLASLDACGGNFSQAARAAGVPEATLRTWAGKPETARSGALRAQKKADLADSLESLAWRLLKAARSKEKIKSASLSQVVVALGIALDKVQLLRSLQKPAPNWQDSQDRPLAHLTDAELEERIAESEAKSPIAAPNLASAE